MAVGCGGEREQGGGKEGGSEEIRLVLTLHVDAEGEGRGRGIHAHTRAHLACSRPLSLVAC